MIDLDELDRINRAGDRYGHITPGKVAELIAEVRRLREDKARLDAGCILTTDYDEFGDRHFTERRGLNLRQMIDNAMALAAKDQS
ncbi:hypothetical protein [Paraburkholderia elongata]|uniref:Uncharacterized protein n=1 Tax=Paraburkholderia elongata TaxID=2675747 RepID=A0A972NV92_9BURK|nr:hypothetical protein [Paraburkholderia elongata]NPT59078.1 hypothetical protein [Paraburkholderia elongata]